MAPKILKSETYADDEAINAYCKKNPRDPRCKCVLNARKMSQTPLGSKSPYYCWYAPCHDKDSYVTSIIQNDMLHCSINICSYASEYVRIDQGELEIINKCKGSFVQGANELLTAPLRTTYELPSYFEKNNIIIVAGLLSIVLLFNY